MKKIVAPLAVLLVLTLMISPALAGNTATFTGEIVAVPVPVAAFVGSPTLGSAPLTVAFTDQSTGSITAWAWDFDNNGVADSTTPNPSYTYTAAGSYTVKLTVTGPGGTDDEVKSGYITVTAPVKPVAAFTGTPTSGSAPLNVQFTDQSSNNPTSWKWEYKKGSGSWTQFSTAQNPSYTFTATGTYSIRLKATNAAGSNTATKTNYVTVTSLPAPVAAFSATPTSGTAPLIVQFTDESTNNPTSWKWEYRKLTGSWIQFSTEQDPTYTFPDASIYSIRLTATNAGGSDTDTKSFCLTVLPPRPIAIFTQDKYLGRAPLTVQFSDRSMNEPTSWAWQFGDGGTSTEQNPRHIYTRSGVHIVQEKVANDAGSDTAYSVVIVF
ncbi:MAG: PKD domain protein [Methanoregulaceae archaeon PtaU1.Bin222]|nr:MAG: PKD domain protein [Methanoregulaceae archaeon PtaU1.Bin222]